MATKDRTAGPTPDAEGEAVPETLLTIEECRDIRAPHAWEHEAAKSLRNWPIGQVVTLSTYDAALVSARTIEVS